MTRSVVGTYFSEDPAMKYCVLASCVLVLADASHSRSQCKLIQPIQLLIKLIDLHQTAMHCWLRQHLYWLLLTCVGEALSWSTVISVNHSQSLPPPPQQFLHHCDRLLILPNTPAMLIVNNFSDLIIALPSHWYFSTKLNFNSVAKFQLIYCLSMSMVHLWVR